MAKETSDKRSLHLAVIELSHVWTITGLVPNDFQNFQILEYH